MYRQTRINKSLIRLKSKIVDQTLIADQIRELVENNLRQFDVSVVCKNISGGDVISVGGSYTSKYISGEKTDIILELHTNKNKNHIYLMAESEFDEFLFQISMILQHELIHKYQQLRRPEDIEQKEYRGGGFLESYLGNLDEIDAYAHDISLEISKNACYNVMRNPSKATEKQSPTLLSYILIFGINHKVMKRLLKKVYLCLQNPMCLWTY